MSFDKLFDGSDAHEPPGSMDNTALSEELKRLVEAAGFHTFDTGILAEDFDCTEEVVKLVELVRSEQAARIVEMERTLPPSGAKVPDDRVYLAVTRPEGYEDVHPGLIVDDMLGQNRGTWEVEILSAAPVPPDQNARNDKEGKNA
jgi:hypothetical protein